MANHPDSKRWSLDSSGKFCVKSLSKHLAASLLWISMFIWAMIYGFLNSSDTLQRKLPLFVSFNLPSLFG